MQARGWRREFGVGSLTPDPSVTAVDKQARMYGSGVVERVHRPEIEGSGSERHLRPMTAVIYVPTPAGPSHLWEG